MTNRLKGFDSALFYADVARAARHACVNMARVCVETGIDPASLARVKTRGQVPDGINLAALCKWAGLDAADYSTESV